MLWLNPKYPILGYRICERYCGVTMFKLICCLFIYIIALGSSYAYVICPDGRYYPDGVCRMNSDGSWRTVLIEPPSSPAKDLMDASKMFDPYGSYRDGAMAKDKYDLKERELELKRLELEKRIRDAK